MKLSMRGTQWYKDRRERSSDGGAMARRSCAAAEGGDEAVPARFMDGFLMGFDRHVAVEEEGSQVFLLCAIESFCGKASSKAVKEMALILKELYNSDVLEELFIVEWYEKGVNCGNKSSSIWKNMKPFVEWLQSAESESEDE